MGRTHEDVEEELLVLSCQDGCTEAFRSLIERWQPRLGRLARRLTADREATADVVQETWLAVARGLRRLNDPAGFRAWIYRIVVHKCADWVRRRARQQAAGDDLRRRATDASNPLPAAERTDDLARLKAALNDLPADQRAVVALHYLDDMGVAEIARTLNVPQGTVKSRLYHARLSLKRELERVQT